MIRATLALLFIIAVITAAAWAQVWLLKHGITNEANAIRFQP